jgi:hypothetical protein
LCHGSLLPLKLQPTLTGCVRQSLHPAVVQISATVKDYPLDALAQRTLRQHLAHHTRLFSLLQALALTLYLWVNGRSGDQRVPTTIVNHLSIDVLQAAKHVQSRPLWHSNHGLSYTPVSPQAGYSTINLWHISTSIHR